MTRKGTLSAGVAMALLLVLLAFLVVLAQEPLSVSISLNNGTFQPGDIVIITGRVKDQSNMGVTDATISIQVEGPMGDEKTIIHVNLVYSNNNGEYQDSFRIQQGAKEGIYAVFITASKPGYADAHQRAEFTVGLAVTTTTTVTASATTAITTETTTAGTTQVTRTTATTTVTDRQPSRACFIATATFGSELSPEVEFLRGFRDKKVMRTFAGRKFMEAFNGFYYSFSPQVAAYLSSNYAARIAMRMALYPLVGALQLASLVYYPLEAWGEAAIVLSGFVASSLIALLYVTPLVLALCALSVKVRLLLGSLRVLAFISTAPLCALSLILVSEITGHGPLMAFSTSSFVLLVVAGSALLGADGILNLCSLVTSSRRLSGCLHFGRRRRP